jgi:hypothetical protein
MTELKIHTTLYFKVPLGTDPEEYMDELRELPKLEMLERATDFGDGELELN